MCGISGIISISGKASGLKEAARLMNAAIRHRGPDGEGFLIGTRLGQVLPVFSEETPDEISSSAYAHAPTKPISSFEEEPQLILSHRRLAIVDLSAAGHQPFCNADASIWITYNGEIYNYPELRAELQSLGRTFRTHTDTEVLLTAYEEWGEKFLHRLNGMWAFVIWNRSENKIFAARDRFGVKPFYYFSDKDVFCFASEQKALLKNPLVKTSLNAAAVANYFVAGEIEYQEESFFKNILELFPSSSLELNLENGKVKIKKWYELPEEEEQPEFSEKKYLQYAEEIRAHFVEAVRIRLRADVTVGSCLSGGIDSSAIAGVIGHLAGKNEKVNIGDKLKLFTAVFDESDIDERKWAAEMVKQTGADWLTVSPKPDELIRDLEDLVYCQDVPIWSTSTYAQYRVMQLVNQSGIRVVLDGQGGDELFAGYPPYYFSFWRELKKRGFSSLAQEEMNQFGDSAKAFSRREYLKQRFVPSLPLGWQLKIQQRYFPDFDYLDRGLISEYKLNYVPKPKVESLNAALRQEFVNTRLKGYLKCEDRCSMWHSVESRTPFAEDTKLIEAGFRIPGTMKIKNGFSKYILREAVSPFIPDSIRLRRDKLGYSTPNNKWITQLKDQFRPYFEQNFEGIFDKEKLMRNYDSFFDIEGKPENGRTFKFVAFAVWRKVMGI
jgi:asparagine synthase (glutamine-hydrolysing)